MTTLDLIARNEPHADGFSDGELPIVPATKTLVLTCADARVDPAHFLGLTPGEALVMRNGGGRVNDSVLTEITMLNAMMALNRGAGPGVEVVIIHHTDCGVSRLADPDVRTRLTEATGIPAEEAARVAAADPYDSVRADIEAIRSSPLVPDVVPITGLVYDVGTGRLSAVN